MNARSIAVTAIAAALLAVGGYLMLVQGSTPDAVGNVQLRPDDPELAAEGRSIYDANCASCHGRELEGQADWRSRDADGMLPAPPHDETGHTWHHPDKVLFAITKYGPSKLSDGQYESRMPGYDDILTDREIIAALSYIKSTWPADIRRRHDRMQADQ